MQKISLLIGVATILALTAFLVFEGPVSTETNDSELEFNEFNAKYKKHYNSLSDKALRFSVFKDNLNLIRTHNKKQAPSYTLGINEFSDLTFEEFKAFYLTEFNHSHTKEHCHEDRQKNKQSPDQLDWNALGKVQKVKNQASCGSCWAFSAIGAIESAHAISGGELPNLSEQELVDCSTEYGNGGCNGGFMHWGFNYILDHNIHESEEYPYTATDDQCQVPEIGEGKFEIHGCMKAMPSIEGLVSAISTNPVSVAFAVQDDFRFYKDGVYNPENCPGQINHGVLAFGYDNKADIPFFNVKNSWGQNWGDQGYFKISQGKGKGTCSMAGNGYNYYPIA